MFYPLSASIGLRYARASKGSSFIAFINLFSVAGIALGLMSLITVLAVMNGFEGELKLRNLGITPHLLVETTQGHSPQNKEFTDIPGVLASAPHLESEGLIQSAQGLKGVMFQGIEPSQMQSSSVIGQNMLVGQLTDLVKGEYGIVIGRALSIKLQLRVGDKARLIASENSYFGPFGRIYSQRIFTVKGIFDMASALDDKVILMNISDATRLLRDKNQALVKTRLFLYDAFDYQNVENKIQEWGYSSISWRVQQGALFDAVKMEKNMMSLMLLLIIAVAAFNIVSALVMVVSEKKSDIAILLTQGMTRKNVMSIFLFNGAYNGIKGTFIGLVLGVLLVHQINNLLVLFKIPVFLGPNGQGLPVDLQWPQVAVLVAVSLILCFAASLYPAYKALNVSPAKALKYE
ncbi:lipoprotein-releasing ABC transporter permease subunit [Paraglaciecola aquimarina]|uniref:Lipoprotein-releasing ABC transporter permease subunit n=1 Tax=Paraglaciecola algarum TaxID=3050085 RepID=A0ABS9D311_9ALTE|nr:lipoprotein-releasing ABC transporter permease subunit [Paraglaciecola sp. G1-23]MCF2946999.1 lipoprotein-releasing ABC transporter permease subunit [Paraglaciecola sp. G1-23]